MWTQNGRPVICRVDRAALLRLEAQRRHWDPISVFERNRRRIEVVASRLYAQGARKPLVTPQDLSIPAKPKSLRDAGYRVVRS
ncbi:MAG: DUF1488 family protein [Hyphomicrobiaceae bacterium]